MTPDEIWLRLMKVSSLYGDRMVEIAQRLCAAASVDREALHAVGMTAAQAKLFFRLDEHELDETRRWLEQPDHHLLRGDDPRYPLRLKAIADYPGALLVSGDPPCFTARSLPLLAVACTPGMAPAGETVQRNAGA
jgi:DNA processing protein